MTLETLRDKIAKSEQKIEKLEGTKARYAKSLEKKEAELADLASGKLDYTKLGYGNVKDALYWEGYKRDNASDGVKDSEKKIAKEKETIAQLNGCIEAILAKDKTRTNPALVQFLDYWREMSYKWYTGDNLEKAISQMDAYKAFLDSKKEEFNAIWQKWRDKYENHEIYENHVIGWKEADRHSDIERNNIKYAYTKKNISMPTWTIYPLYEQAHKDKDAYKKMIGRMLDDEWKRKYDDLIERITAYVGKIVDASAISVNEKDNLDGVVVGELGKVYVQTIGCGGYNIVRFHYRTILERVK